MRPEAVIVLIAFLVCAAWGFLQDASACRARDILRSLFLVFLGYVLTTKGAELVLMLTGILPDGLQNACPEWKFALGLDFTGQGGYSEKNLFLLDISDAAQRRAALWDILKASWQSSSEHLDFFLGKLRILWVRDAGSAWTALPGDFAVLPSLSLRRMDYYFHQLHLALYAILAVSGLFALPTMLHDDDAGNRARLTAVILIGFFLVYLLIEVQPRYRYELMPLLAVMSAAGSATITRRKEI